MGGKGRKRREKNYRAAHGEHSRLPPPPQPSSVDALPSKLRAIMAFTNSSEPGSAALASNEKRNGGLGSGNRNVKKLNSKGKIDSNRTGTRGKGNDGNSVTARQVDDDDNRTQEERKKMKKRKRVTDLRFETLEERSGVGLKRREHKKKRLEAKKNKRKKVRFEENEGFPGHEKIKFGEVVQAPPKLVVFPKALKAPQDASQERLRLKAVEAYRNRNRWASRPGMDLPPPIRISPTL